MDGQTLVSKLQDLDIPCSKQLRGDDFDWAFLGEASQPLLKFWSWFVTNISPDLVLQEAEIKDYEDLVASGSSIPGSRLKQIESYVGCVPPEEETRAALDFSTNEVEDDAQELKQDLKSLQTRKNFLSSQKLEVAEEANRRREVVRRLRQELESRRRRVQAIGDGHSSALERLCSGMDTVVSPLRPFQREEAKEAVFLTQAPSRQWEEEEAAFKDAVVTFIGEQFHESIDHLAAEVNASSSYGLLEARQASALQLVRGPGQGRYLQQAKELDRLTAMLEATQTEAAEGLLQKARADAEVGEALGFLKAFRARAPAPLPLVRQQTAPLKEAAKELREKAEWQRSTAAEEASQLARGERRRVLGSSYGVKLQRQTYFLSKLDQVKGFVVRRAARVALAKMAVEADRTRIRALVEVVGRLYAILDARRCAHLARMEDLALLREFWVVDGGATRQEKEALRHLLALDTDDAQAERDVSSLESRLTATQQEVESASEAQLTCLNQLYSSVGRLEECLFGAAFSACDLPRTWAGSRVAEGVARAEEGVWAVQQDMLDALRDIERKKKLLKDNPSVKEDLAKWTRDG